MALSSFRFCWLPFGERRVWEREEAHDHRLRGEPAAPRDGLEDILISARTKTFHSRTWELTKECKDHGPQNEEQHSFQFGCLNLRARSR
jgi:hypothetical protein